MIDGNFLTLGIETSCDETAVAVVRNGREVLSNVISSQIPIHTRYGGVVPEIASRRHLEAINAVFEQAVREAEQKLGRKVTRDTLDLIAVTKGPGLIGALVIGVAFAKALAWAWDLPLVGVNHMYGHMSSNFIRYPNLKPPFLCLVVSGGHTNLLFVEDYTRARVIGKTRDDAAGEAFDKVARVLGLGYPGGPKINRLAEQGDPTRVPFKRVYLERDGYDFSFSGMKTAVLNYVNHAVQTKEPLPIADVAAGFQEAVVDVLTEKAVRAAETLGEKRLVLAGGVGANTRLRIRLRERAEEKGLSLYMPDPALCTDNGAMIAVAGYYQYQKKGGDSLTLDAVADLPYGPEEESDDDLIRLSTL